MTKPKLLIATHNKGKLALMQKMLAGVAYEVISLDDLGITEDVEETGSTYEENASLKAQTYAQMSGLFTLADDGGLEVEALDGAPGIYSARYAGPNKTDAQKVDFLLEKIKDVPEGKRQAQFVGVLALAKPDGELKLYRGALPGRLTFGPQGEPRKQLPYRQIFVPDGFDKTLDELDDEGVAYISHRQKAMNELIRDL